MPHHISLAMQVFVTASGIFASTVLVDSLIRATRIYRFLRNGRHRQLIPESHNHSAVTPVQSVRKATIICPGPPAFGDDDRRRKTG